MEILWEVVAAAREGRGGVALVEGEAGIGKTSLLEHIAARASAEGIRVLRARGTPLEREFGLGIVRQLFERAVLAADEPEREALVSGAVGVAAAAIGLASDRTGASDAFAVQHGLYWLACNVAESAPIVLLVDDAQWSDVPSLRWLVYLARRLDGVALALLVAWRTGELGASEDLLELLRGEAVGATLTPLGLSEQATAALVRGALRREADSRFCRACHETTGGNPFFVRSLLEAVQGAVIAPTGEATWRVERLGPIGVRRYVLVRLSRLGENAISLARAVSVLDTDAEPRFAYALAGLEPLAGSEAAETLEAARIVEGADRLRFAHPILRAAVYEDLPMAARATKHRRAAQLLIEQGGDRDRAAVHLLATPPGGDAWVTEQLRQASERAQVRGTPEMALSLLERAMAEPATPQLRPGLLLAAGRAARILARPQAKTYLDRARCEARTRDCAARPQRSSPKRSGTRSPGRRSTSCAARSRASPPLIGEPNGSNSSCC